MKDTSHLVSILIISKPKGELNLFISPTEAIFAEISKSVICKGEGTNNKEFVLPRMDAVD